MSANSSLKASDKGLLRAFRAIAHGLQRAPRAGAALVWIAWAVLIWSLSARSPSEIAEISPWGSVLTNMAHAPEYGLFTLWLILAVPREAGFPALQKNVMAFIVAMVMAYAISDEIHQSFTPGRDASVIDLMTDLSGTLLVLRLAFLTTRPGTTTRDLVRAFVIGISACILCAILASFVPSAFPQYGWL